MSGLTITVQKLNFKTLFSDVGEFESYFMALYNLTCCNHYVNLQPSSDHLRMQTLRTMEAS